jgi:Uma2 family endonuclease
MTVAKIPLPVMTPEEYLAWEVQQLESHEYIRGTIFAMSGGSYAHNQIVVNLVHETRRLIQGKPCRNFTSSQRVQAEEGYAYFYPDVGIFCGTPQLGVQDTILNPLVLFEVLSPSTERRDRTKKYDSYRTIESLEEYFLVHQDVVRVEAFRRPKEGEWSQSLHTAYMGLETELVLESVGVRIPLSAIYEGLEISEMEIEE